MRNVVVLAVVAACLAAGASAASVGLAPGTYVTKVSGATPALLNGTWRLTVTKKRYTVTRNRQPAIAGSVAISSKRVSFHDLSGPFRCQGSQAVGTYAWRLRGKSLTLTAVQDACSGRKAILTHGFTKSS
jgi:hypothetical protein